MTRPDVALVSDSADYRAALLAALKRRLRAVCSSGCRSPHLCVRSHRKNALSELVLRELDSGVLCRLGEHVADGARGLPCSQRRGVYP